MLGSLSLAHKNLLSENLFDLKKNNRSEAPTSSGIKIRKAALNLLGNRAVIVAALVPRQWWAQASLLRRSTSTCVRDSEGACEGGFAVFVSALSQVLSGLRLSLLTES